ncbi:lysine--tRNA ligase [Propylenella binzhouense]|uniref:Lysine--tRNA ligase n=1 Tax=Propylenella binzhouense TaxID=2555902 RepID=A0A964T3H5_9HYPH|nr:lysine--tRNA ligase [Propylenella binzhouense]MYZ47619.1 lysine--tRNA ligase [Propylenella binzhouense]
MTDRSPFPPELVAAARVSKAWPFEEARKLLARVEKAGFDGEILFETGYGPSGLPHIGTFGEVARTTMVRHAFRVLTGDRVPTRLLCFSDDMDALRKVPDNVPNREALAADLGKPLTQVRDPFGEYESFGGGNNQRLRAFLDRFGFDYEFASATDYYRSGRFDATLLAMLAAYDAVMAIILPTLGPERRETYSPFLPVSERTGRVLQVPMIARDVAAGTVTYRDPDTGEAVTTPVTGGRVKCQWKADWALRWTALGVDYEMAGKDLIDSVLLSSRICKALGGTPPEGFNYELFLDEHGQKISKSKGNGLTIEEWLRYASPESLSLFMFQKPKAAKRLYFDVIPRAADEYYQFLDGYRRQDPGNRLSNPVWHIHAGDPPQEELPVPFSMLLNIASAGNTEEPEILWGYVTRHLPEVTPERYPALDRLIGYAVRYYHDFVKPNKHFRVPDAVEREALEALDSALSALPEDAGPDAVQNAVYDVGRGFERYRNPEKPGPDGRPGVALTWFSTLYEILLGQERGPRFGSFVAIYGIPETRALIRRALRGELRAAAARS